MRVVSKNQPVPTCAHGTCDRVPVCPTASGAGGDAAGEPGAAEATSERSGVDEVSGESPGAVEPGLASGRTELDVAGAACGREVAGAACGRELPHAEIHATRTAADNKLRAAPRRSPVCEDPGIGHPYLVRERTALGCTKLNGPAALRLVGVAEHEAPIVASVVWPQPAHVVFGAV